MALKPSRPGGAPARVPGWLWAWLGGTALVLAWRWIKNEDLGFQLHAAKLILETGGVPRGEPFLWTEPEGTYTDLQWLWQLAMYGCWRWVGYGGLILANLGLQFLAFGVWVWRAAKLGYGSLGFGGLLLLALFLLINPCVIRPHNLSWVYLGLTLLTLEEHARGQRRAIWFLPLIFLFWVNSHALFSLGLLAAASWMLVAWGRILAQAGWPAARPRLFDTVFPVGVAGALCLVNPYGWQGLAFPLQQARIVAGTHAARNYILEFQPLWAALVTPDRGFSFMKNWFDSIGILLLLLLIFVGLLLGRKKIPVPAWGPILILTVLAAQMVKNFNYFFILVGPYAASGLDAWIKDGPARVPKFAMRLIVGTCLFFCWAVPTGWWSNWTWGMPFGRGFDAKVHPTEVAMVLQRCPQQLRLLNGPDIGGWIGWISGRKVFLDGRNDNYSEALFLSYFEALQSKADFIALLDKWQIEAVVARYATEPMWAPALIELSRRSQGAFKDSAGRVVPLWRCVARDAHTALFLRYDVGAEIPGNLHHSPGFDALAGREPRLEAILRSQAEKKEAGWQRLFLGVEAFPVEANLLVARSLDFGEYSAGKGYAIAGMEGCPWFFPNLWYNLAILFEMEGERARADFCWQTLAKKTSDPKWRDGEKRALRRRQGGGGSGWKDQGPKP